MYTSDRTRAPIRFVPGFGLLAITHRDDRQ